MLVPMYVYMHGTFGLWFVSRSMHEVKTITVCQAFKPDFAEEESVGLLEGAVWRIELGLLPLVASE